MSKHTKNNKHLKRYVHHVDHDGGSIHKRQLDQVYGKIFPKFIGWGRLHAIQIKHTTHGEHAWLEALMDKKPKTSWKHYRKHQWRE